MKLWQRRSFTLASASLVAVLIGFAAAPGSAFADAIKVTLSGSQEVPPVATSASGSGTVTVNSDKTVSGVITTRGVAATMAHIHNGAAGKNGPVIIPLSKTGDSGWSVPPGAKLTNEQYQAFKAGNLYINVHSEAHKGGEIRGQLKP